VIDMTAMATYFAVMSITPGPNNVMVTSSGAAYGYRATLPHVLGIGLGAALQMVLVALGVGVVFQRFPLLHSGLAIVAAVYLVYLASPRSGGGQGRACEWSRCLVLHTSYESELLQVAHAVMDSSRITQIKVFMVLVPGTGTL
jgi:LysE type translocator